MRVVTSPSRRPLPTRCLDAPTCCSLPSLQHLCQACGRTCCLLCVINHVFDESAGTAKRLCAQCLDAATLLSERSLASEAAADGTDGVTYDYERQSLAGTSLFVVNLAEVTLDLNVAADARLARITGTAVRYVEATVQSSAAGYGPLCNRLPLQIHLDEKRQWCCLRSVTACRPHL